jgi:ATP-dependent DNA helicase PIF1
MNQAQALKILATGANVFLTGEPGSGKTYTINQYVSFLRSHGIEPAITASTGIAATHINGITIHSWSGIGIKEKLNKAELNSIAGNDYVLKRIGPAKVLIIDEISMLGPDTLQMIDSVCREIKKNNLPFGGIQVVLVGDFFQLPPVVKKSYNEFSQENLFGEESARFCYDSSIWRQAEFITCYLTEQHRQDDSDFLELLSKIRNNNFDELSLQIIKQRKTDLINVPPQAPKLYSHNFDVDTINDRMLAKISSQAQFFPMLTKGHEALIKVMKKGCLSPEQLYLKVGAAVMFTKNNPKEGYVNGTLGIIEGFCQETELPIVCLRNGRKVTVDYAEWVVEEDGRIRGRISQIPLRLAWAITIHKSQGISLDEAVIDLSKVFEFGQGYVALSRVRRLEGIYLLGWNERAFQVDEEILAKDNELRIESNNTEIFLTSLSEEKVQKIQDEFIKNCGGKIKTTDVVIKNKGIKIPTQTQTLELWKQGKTIFEIAKIRNINHETVMTHVEALIKNGSIAPADLKREVSPKLLKDLEKIQIIFTVLKTTKLTPVFEHFKGKYTYFELKIAKMMF